MLQRLEAPGLKFEAWLIPTNPIRNADHTFVLGFELSCIIFPSVADLGFESGEKRSEVYAALKAMDAEPISDGMLAMRTIARIHPGLGRVYVWTDVSRVPGNTYQSQFLFGFKATCFPNAFVCEHDYGRFSNYFKPTDRIAAHFQGMGEQLLR